MAAERQAASQHPASRAARRAVPPRWPAATAWRGRRPALTVHPSPHPRPAAPASVLPTSRREATHQHLIAGLQPRSQGNGWCARTRRAGAAGSCIARALEASGHAPTSHPDPCQPGAEGRSPHQRGSDVHSLGVLLIERLADRRVPRDPLQPRAQCSVRAPWPTPCQGVAACAASSMRSPPRRARRMRPSAASLGGRTGRRHRPLSRPPARAGDARRPGLSPAQAVAAALARDRRGGGVRLRSGGASSGSCSRSATAPATPPTAPSR